MEKHRQTKKVNTSGTKVTTFPVPFALGEKKENITISTNTLSKLSKEQIINQAFKFHSQGNIPQATKYYQLFINQGGRDHRVFYNYGVILKNLGKLEDAELLYRKAIEIKSDFAEAHSNLGGILKDLGKLQDAELSTRKAIEIKPDFADTYSNLGVILKDLGKLEEAELSTRRAIELKPDLANNHSNLGLILLEKGSHELSLKYFSNSAELLRGENNQDPNTSIFKDISKAKIEHDIEQFEYLVSQDYETQKFTKLAILYKKIATEINWPSETQLITLNNKHQSLLKDSYNRLINVIEAPRLQKEAVNNSLNIEEITKNYFDHEFGLTYIDNFLNPTALKSLRKFLLGSTIWFDVKSGGYLGAYLKEGLASPLIIQIAEELRKKFPKIFKNHPIKGIWAYKYDSRAKNENSLLRGIKVHADQAAINVNFWITPKEANLNPKSGGLIVYDVEAPHDWDFKIYNNPNDKTKIREELKKSKGNTQVIPHNQNRAVIFNSNLFHETDSYEFKDGYENRRINVTLLFGRREDS
ncbi:tetratricopeptide repeat protein [Prochlorococcus marinus]|uniref:tetratricopeptide repeat protein n=1 Tax=Prochlorococcus marinus TaxID=1219 RepID=UPI0022B36403|nr:tetratricopeptide repeat protein [Prochlorococcus marinus]